MNERDLSWLAGLLEGEGCFTGRKWTPANGGTKITPRIQARMTDEDVLQRVRAIAGGTVSGPYHPHGARRPIWNWQVSGAVAVRVAKELRPLMGERRQRAIDDLLALQA